MPRVSRRPTFFPLSLVLLLGGCSYLFPSCETIPDCPDAAVTLPVSDGGLVVVWLPTVLCTNLTCSDLHTDPFNCGACNNVCAAGLTCVAVLDGGAECICPAEGQTLMNGSCLALAIDPLNCGAIGNACQTNHVCYDGGCVCPSPTYLDGGVSTDCPSDAGADAGLCVDVLNDPGNCGTCGTFCENGCAEGACLEPGETLDAGDEGEPDAGDAGEADAGDGGEADAGDGG